MDEAHYCAEAFSPITGRCFQVVSRQGGQAGRAGFCSRSPAEPARSWVQRFTPLFADAARRLRHATGDRWFVDETYVKVAGRWRYLYRAVDQYGQVIDVMLSEQRDTAAARRFFARALAQGPAPVEVTTVPPLVACRRQP